MKTVGVTKIKNIKNYFGEKIGIDIYYALSKFVYTLDEKETKLTDNDGNPTTHLKRIFDGTKGLLMNGIKPVYIFYEQSKVFSTCSAYNSQIISSVEINEIKRLLTYLGIPFVNSISECTILLKTKEIYGVATSEENQKSFGAKILLRDLPFQEKTKTLMTEVHFNEVSSFADKDQKIELKWRQPDEENLIKFLCNEKQFNEENLCKGIKKIKESLIKFRQTTLHQYFKKGKKQQMKK
ncbi:hypothetical protein PVAND_001068 [Polypedilum vanderplanki]|uniref:XPG N-terminal domain-containing protein n=1 Tax=Polypedilum vanderplanki TaxID=319348 RepID=A0A9J6BM41_POLVA|nr:hypothetical protein PVAND_001068 [Polypedilum vanderplanki]